MAVAKGVPNYNKIIIIGAGVAGLSVATHLIKNGVNDFKIIEARNRIGGRIVSAKTDKHKVELGANWIHGVLGNPMYELAIANGLIDIINIPKQHKVIAATEGGKQISFHLLQDIYEAYVCFLRRCEEYFLCQYSPPTGIYSVGEHVALEIAIYLDSIMDPEERILRKMIFECLLKRETCITGCNNMNDIDLLELGSYTELQGGNISLPSGYSSILKPLSQDIPTSVIITGQPVRVINWQFCKSGNLGDNDNGDSDSDDSDKTVTGNTSRWGSSCSRENSVEREVSKSENTQDNPNPCLDFETAESSQCFDSGGGNLCKEFDRLVSINSKGRPNLCEVVCETGEKYYADHIVCTVPLGVLKEKANTLFNPPLPKYKLDAIQRLLFGTVNKIVLEYDRPFLHPDISEVMLLWESDEKNLEEDMKDSWYKKIYSFSKITDTLLLGWISGKEAEFMESLPSDHVSEVCTNILRKFLNDPYIPKPKLCICTHWHSQPYSRGSYTAMAVGASQEDIENLAQPLYSNSHQDKPSVLFAGEHTHSSFYSTVHGAYITGRSVAQLLITPSSPREMVLDCNETSDLSSWLEGISLE